MNYKFFYAILSLEEALMENLINTFNPLKVESQVINCKTFSSKDINFTYISNSELEGVSLCGIHTKTTLNNSFTTPSKVEDLLTQQLIEKIHLKRALIGHAGENYCMTDFKSTILSFFTQEKIIERIQPRSSYFRILYY